MYTRKTKDVWHVQQYWDKVYGWETVTAEETYREARERAKEYRENQPFVPVRIVIKREKITA